REPSSAPVLQARSSSRPTAVSPRSRTRSTPAWAERAAATASTSTEARDGPRPALSAVAVAREPATQLRARRRPGPQRRSLPRAPRPGRALLASRRFSRSAGELAVGAVTPGAASLRETLEEVAV